MMSLSVTYLAKRKVITKRTPPNNKRNGRANVDSIYIRQHKTGKNSKGRLWTSILMFITRNCGSGAEVRG